MNIALILSGGTGSRLQCDIPKQYIEVCRKPVILYCMETIASHPVIDRIQIVANEIWRERIKEWMENADMDILSKFSGFSDPGDTRQLSVYNGLKDILTYADAKDTVLIHDAARPLLSAQMITECFFALKDHDGILPVLPMKDTVYFSESGKKADELLARQNIFAGQAPECFVLGKYMQANEKLLPDKIRGINGSAEPAVLAGMDIAMIPGDEKNFKITTQDDLDRFRQIVASRNAGSI